LLHPASGRGVRCVSGVSGLVPASRSSTAMTILTPLLTPPDDSFDPACWRWWLSPPAAAKATALLAFDRVTAFVSLVALAASALAVTARLQGVAPNRIVGFATFRCRVGRALVIYGLCSPPRSSLSSAASRRTGLFPALPQEQGSARPGEPGVAPPRCVYAPSPAIAPTPSHPPGSWFPDECAAETVRSPGSRSLAVEFGCAARPFLGLCGGRFRGCANRLQGCPRASCVRRARCRTSMGFVTSKNKLRGA